MARQYQDTETRRLQVAQAALRTIVEDGVSGFTTRAVAQRVGISDGTLFRHFGSKQEIMLEAMSVLEIEIDASMISTGDALRDIEGFFRHRANFVGGQDAVGSLVFSDELVHLAGDEGRERVAGWRERSVSYLVGRLTSLSETGELRSDVPIQGMAMLIQGALLTFVLQRTLHLSGSEADLERRINAAWSVLHSVLVGSKS